MAQQSGYMTLEVDLPNNHFASLCGTSMKYWIGEGLPVYQGPIDEAPQKFIDALLKAGAICKAD